MYNKHVLHMLDLSKSLWVHHFKAQLHIKRERHSCWHSASNRVQGTGLLQGVKLSLVNVIHLQGTISFIYRYHLAVNRLNKTMDSRLGHRVSKKKKKNCFGFVVCFVVMLLHPGGSGLSVGRSASRCKQATMLVPSPLLVCF